MSIQHNYLRWYRKRSMLTQEDLVSVLGIKDKSMVSRWEQGQRTPDIYTLLGYHVLFDIPVELMFARQKNTLVDTINKRITERIEYLKGNRPDGQALKRIEFLGSTLTRLNDSADVYEAN